jgi:hypothetical protein
MLDKVGEIGLVSLVFLLVYCLFAFVFSDGKIDHCYIVKSQGGYTLVGNVPYKTNVMLGDYATADEAVKFAKEQNCEMFAKEKTQ